MTMTWHCNQAWLCLQVASTCYMMILISRKLAKNVLVIKHLHIHALSRLLQIALGLESHQAKSKFAPHSSTRHQVANMKIHLFTLCCTFALSTQRKLGKRISIYLHSELICISIVVCWVALLVDLQACIWYNLATLRRQWAKFII